MKWNFIIVLACVMSVFFLKNSNISNGKKTVLLLSMGSVVVLCGVYIAKIAQHLSMQKTLIILGIVMGFIVLFVVLIKVLQNLKKKLKARNTKISSTNNAKLNKQLNEDMENLFATD